MDSLSVGRRINRVRLSIAHAAASMYRRARKIAAAKNDADALLRDDKAPLTVVDHALLNFAKQHVYESWG